MLPIITILLSGILFGQWSCVAASNVKRDKISGFQNVAGQILEGHALYYNADMSKCTSRDGLRHAADDEFNGVFGGYVDFFELINDKKVADIPIFKFSNARHERNSTDNLVTIHRQMEYWDNETLEVTISVLTPDLQTTLKMYQYSCPLGNTSDGFQFYASTSAIKPIRSFKSLLDLLTTGHRVRYISNFRICEGAIIFSSIGGEMKDFDVVNTEKHTTIKTTVESMILNNHLHFDQHILYGEILDSGMISFTESYWSIGTDLPDFKTETQCYMQQNRPGGSVEFYQVPT